VVDEIILPGLHVFRGAKVHAVQLAYRLDLLVRARQANHLGVELGQILLEDLGRVASRVAGDEDGDQNAGVLGLDHVVHGSHLVELVGADIWTMAEAKVDLRKEKTNQISTIGLTSSPRERESLRNGRGGRTNQRIPPLQFIAAKRLAVLVDQFKVASNLWLSDALGRISDALAVHALLLVFKVPDEAGAARNEKQASFPRERTDAVPALLLIRRARLEPLLLEALGSPGALSLEEWRGGGGCRGGRRRRAVRGRRLCAEEPAALPGLGLQERAHERRRLRN
jgi:hypothetical protein